MVLCLERGADLHMAQLMPLPLTVSCFSKIQIRFTFLVPAHPGSPGKMAVKLVYVCMSISTKKLENDREHFTAKATDLKYPPQFSETARFSTNWLSSGMLFKVLR